jgi:hypothetical protein
MLGYERIEDQKRHVMMEILPMVMDVLQAVPLKVCIVLP